MIFVSCLLTNPSTGQSCIVDAVWDTGAQRTAISESACDCVGLKKGKPIEIEGSAGIAHGWETKCNIAITEYDKWITKVDILPQMPVHMVIGMDIISTGDLLLKHINNEYIFQFEQT